MRITNIEKFRNELYEAIEDTCKWSVDTPGAIFKSDFKMIDGNVRVISLVRPMKIENGKLYITVDEDAVCFWRSENGYFEFDGYIEFELYRNKLSKEVQTMDTNITWDNEELEIIEELNEIFNL